MRSAAGIGTMQPPLGPVLAVWALGGLMSTAVFVTYSRIAPERLYHVSGDGLAGGASRLVVLLSFPIAVLALPLLLLVVERLRRTSGVGAREKAVVSTIAVAAAALCATAVVSVDEADLDARPVNALTVAGALLAFALTVYVARRTGVGQVTRPLPGAAWTAVAVLLVAALPWLAADVGFSLGEIPVLGDVFNADEVAVHLGHHHGLDGIVFAVAAILAWPALSSMAPSRMRSLTVFLVALELSYGIANAAQDGWLEQVVKRGWSETELPSVLHPSLSFGWGGIVAAAAALSWLASRRLARHSRDDGQARLTGDRAVPIA